LLLTLFFPKGSKLESIKTVRYEKLSSKRQKVTTAGKNNNSPISLVFQFLFFITSRDVLSKYFTLGSISEMCQTVFFSLP